MGSGLVTGLGCFRNIRCLRAFLALHNLELYLISFLQTFITFRRNSAVVYENIGPIFASDKSIPFSIVKPLHRTFQTFHVNPPGMRLAQRGMPYLLPLCCCHTAMSSMGNTQKALFSGFAGITGLGEPEHAGDSLGVADGLIHDHINGFGKRYKVNFNDFVGFRLCLAGSKVLS